ncbi:hypothetical protein PIROE2DRAFT_10673, partial [Piromyces sp. E2]
QVPQGDNRNQYGGVQPVQRQSTIMDGSFGVSSTSPMESPLSTSPRMVLSPQPSVMFDPSATVINGTLPMNNFVLSGATQNPSFSIQNNIQAQNLQQQIQQMQLQLQMLQQSQVPQPQVPQPQVLQAQNNQLQLQQLQIQMQQLLLQQQQQQQLQTNPTNPQLQLQQLQQLQMQMQQLNLAQPSLSPSPSSLPVNQNDTRGFGMNGVREPSFIISPDVGNSGIDEFGVCSSYASQ